MDEDADAIMGENEHGHGTPVPHEDDSAAQDMDEDEPSEEAAAATASASESTTWGQVEEEMAKDLLVVPHPRSSNGKMCAQLLAGGWCTSFATEAEVRKWARQQAGEQWRFVFKSKSAL